MTIPIPGPTHGFSTLTVTVEDVNRELHSAVVKDTYGKRHTIRTDVRRTGWFLPRVDEVWIIDQSLGFWSFAAVITPEPELFEEVHDGNPALVKFLALLDSLGLITNETIPPPGPISTHEHI